MTSPNVSFEQLVAYVAGELDQAAALAVEAHLNASPAARDAVERLHLLRNTYQSDDSTPAPASVVARAKELFAERRIPKRESLLDALKRIVAELTYDSRPQFATAGLRGAATTYQLCFESESADIDLEVERISGATSERRRVRGQVSPKSGSGADSVSIKRHGADGSLATSGVDADGMFTFEIEPGSFEVLIEMPAVSIVLPNVEIE